MEMEIAECRLQGAREGREGTQHGVGSAYCLFFI